MRTKEQWNERVYPKLLKQFSPRLQQSITKYPLESVPIFGSYYIYGPTGSGKTTMAAHMYITAWKEKYFKMLPGAYIFVTMQEVFDNLQKAIRQNPFNHLEPDDEPPRDEFAIMAEYSSCTYLVLDDVGSTRFTDWSASQLQVLINNRYEEMLTTVITSNFSLAELSDALGDKRTSSRSERMGKTIKLK